MNFIDNTALAVVLFGATLSTILSFNLSLKTFLTISTSLLVALLFIAKYTITPKFDRQFKALLIENSEVFFQFNFSRYSTATLMESNTCRTVVYCRLITFKNSSLGRDLLNGFDFRKNSKLWQLVLCQAFTVSIVIFSVLLIIFAIKNF